MIKRTITTGLGALTPSAWQDIVAAVDVAVGPQDEGGSAGGRSIGQPRIIRAKITTAQQVSGIARWQYDWAQVRRTNGNTTFTAVTNGMTSASNGGKKAVNTLEAGNTASLAYGYTVTSGTSLTNHAGFSIQRVPVDAVVDILIFRDTSGATSFEFSAANPIDGVCQGSGLTPEEQYNFGTYADPYGSDDFGTHIAPIGQADFGEYDAPAS